MSQSIYKNNLPKCILIHFNYKKQLNCTTGQLTKGNDSLVLNVSLDE